MSPKIYSFEIKLSVGSTPPTVTEFCGHEFNKAKIHSFFAELFHTLKLTMQTD